MFARSVNWRNGERLESFRFSAGITLIYIKVVWSLRYQFKISPGTDDVVDEAMQKKVIGISVTCIIKIPITTFLQHANLLTKYFQFLAVFDF